MDLKELQNDLHEQIEKLKAASDHLMKNITDKINGMIARNLPYEDEKSPGDK